MSFGRTVPTSRKMDAASRSSGVVRLWFSSIRQLACSICFRSLNDLVRVICVRLRRRPFESMFVISCSRRMSPDPEYPPLLGSPSCCGSFVLPFRKFFTSRTTLQLPDARRKMSSISWPCLHTIWFRP